MTFPHASQRHPPAAVESPGVSEITRLSPAARPAARAAAATPPPAGAAPDRAPEGLEELQEVNSLLKGHTSRWDEARILDILRGADAPKLNFLLQTVDRDQLLSDVDDHTAGPKNKTALLTLVSQDRVEDLTVETRALMVDALQRGKTRQRDERAIRNLFVATRGPQQTQLKNLVDKGDDHYDMHQLLHHDLDHQEYRQQILAHIAENASPTGHLKVMSDIDDTFYANWVDERYPKQTVYPGVRQFYAELDKRAGSDPGDQTFLTARPDDRLGKVKTATKRSLKSRGIDECAVVAGALLSLISNEAIAAKKFEGYQEYREIFPEYNTMFVGDSGQGDALLGLKIQGTPGLEGVYIHDVKHTPQAERDDWRSKGVVFFDTYAGAAVEAHLQGVLPLEGAARVGQAAVADFAQVKFKSETQREGVREVLQRDLDRLNGFLPPDQQVSIPSVLPDLNALPEVPVEDLPHNN